MEYRAAVNAFLRKNCEHPLLPENLEGLECQVLGNKNFRFSKPDHDKALCPKPFEPKAIGFTGWNYLTNTSHWVGFDIDSILNHSKGHTYEAINEILETFKTYDNVSVVRSTSGLGYHFFIHFDPSNLPSITSRKEHIALSKATLDTLITIDGNLVDCCGMILWFWKDTQNEHSFELVQQATKQSIPPDIEKQRKINYSCDSNNYPDDSVSLDGGHRRLIDWLRKNAQDWWWNSEKSILVTHTYTLLQAHKELKLDGYFQTSATGETGAATGSDHNCFAIPIEQGGWIVYRFNIDCDEDSTWHTNAAGYRYAYFNTTPSIAECGKVNSAIRLDNGKFIFTRAGIIDTVQRMGIKCSIPDKRQFEAANKSGFLCITTERNKNDNCPDGWIEKGNTFFISFEIPKEKIQQRIRVPHDILRHVTFNGVEYGWYINTDGDWVSQNKNNVVDFLYSKGIKNTRDVIGKAVEQHWNLVNEPFKPEYPGKRIWNFEAAQYSVIPSRGDFPMWKTVLNHHGKTLDIFMEENSWCVENNIKTGAEYLFLWLAWLFQKPEAKLPYLFFFGPQNNGKSTFHEAIKLLLRKEIGYVRADRALTSDAGFNGELHNAIVCIVEETPLNKRESAAYNRIKDWTTASDIAIRPLHKAVYRTRNLTHWIQCGNSINECPILPGDTRVTAVWINPPKEYINKDEIFRELIKEAPGILYALITCALPEPCGRLQLPIIESGERQDIIEGNYNEVQEFIRLRCFYVPGELMLFSDFCAEITKEFDISKIMIGKHMKDFNEYPKGRALGDGQQYIGNISFEQKEAREYRFRKNKNGRLMKEII